jgi:hypothetical protein
MASNAERPSSHIACRSNNPSKLINYQVGSNEKPIIVSDSTNSFINLDKP